VVLLSLCALVDTSRGMKLEEVEVTCPLDGSVFKTLEQVSGYQTGLGLDLRSEGALRSPWPVARCPSNGFVIYKERYSDAELIKLRAYVASSEYQSLVADHTDHYLAARLQRFMGESAATVVYTLLKATWEAGSSDEIWRQILEESVREAGFGFPSCAAAPLASRVVGIGRSWSSEDTGARRPPPQQPAPMSALERVKRACRGSSGCRSATKDLAGEVPFSAGSTPVQQIAGLWQ